MNASDVAVLAGAVCVSGGAALAYLPAGIVLAGVFLLLIGLGVSDDR